MKQEKKSLPHKEYGMMMSTDALRSLKGNLVWYCLKIRNKGKPDGCVKTKN